MQKIIGALLISFFPLTVGFALNTTLKASTSSLPPVEKRVLSKSLKTYPPKTALSRLAMQLHVGMTKKEVIQLLGKPTWADSCKGEALALAWRNGNCNPVTVSFDDHMKIKAYDQGRAICLEVSYKDLPSDQFLCSSSLRQQQLCQVSKFKV